ncbi:RimK family alpha-L-glutamate ligase [Sandaracinobacter sp. RS1-74]|uniref:ATP-grasp domain-containing protein n=1 Tax=Sandaracinobacteroides sayramensis TaxID=2913411 RepID=UPI001EDC1AEC|nr:RimK family alpha-L-glutamate ligase [Sandaracinobacteroides sayramensis]MCG2842109.1 RimK family alpha-L-glutamate ligase [Sandaracinobacteroides sayramensis]
MRGWILFREALDPARPEVPEIFRFQEEAAVRGLELHVLDPHKFDLVVGALGNWSVRYEHRALERPDFIMARTGAETDYFTLSVLRHFERRGVRLVNGPTAIDLVADKLHTMQRLARAGLPIPRTILGKFPMEPDLVERELGFPVIVKTLRGTRGTGVLKCEDRDQFEDLAGLLSTSDARADFLFQQYVRASHGRDVRILVVGGRVVAAMERRSLRGGFKSNVSLGGVGLAFQPPPEMAELAVRAAETLQLDVAGIDILFDDDGYRICEANSAPGFQGLERACQVDVPAVVLDWIEASQERAMEKLADRQGDALVDLVFGGPSALRSLGDRSTTMPRYAGAMGVRLVAAGIVCLVSALMPKALSSRAGLMRERLEAVREGRLDALVFQDDSEQEATLLTVLAVSLWAAVLPWLAGASAPIAGAISVLAMAFPLALLMTGERGGRRRPDSATGSKG